MSEYKLTKADKEQIKLFDIVCVSTSIECDRKGCDESDSMDADPLEAVEEFHFRGWRVNKQGYARCPKHSITIRRKPATKATSKPNKK